ncbi:putative Monosaccharide-transporting ATPase [Vibrio nigripulchritudo SOn1]|uniref:Monosaccharide-transporting ATPase n=1 Tax=Vibrio nigripulchritudo SOn1 TaxID=1238450 RepID=A0AAV2VRJ1_9VIBR|nr:sugar ABC transporter ATP-binding protein [Vibrio nigripulchritudo]CCO47274.1 putative Monosaccharide-transporting ATPase [Vibrio nigripulchritudo SOn1]
MNSNVISMSGIDKKFGSVTALDNVDFELRKGEIHALLGMNGAGKSTLIKILSGIYQKDGGQIEIEGREVQLGTPSASLQQGIVSVQQHPEMIDDFTGYENIFLGRENNSFGLFSLFNSDDLKRRADELLEKLPIPVNLDRTIAEMNPVEREATAILHSMVNDKITALILDEPTSTLTEKEKQYLFELMSILKSSGVSIIYITHRLEEVKQIADRFTVFRNGKNVGCHDVAQEALSPAAIAELMLGKSVSNMFPPKLEEACNGDAYLQIENLSFDSFSNVSFEARKGEILGIFGLVGSGIEDLSKVIFGARIKRGGTIRIHGEKVEFETTQDALNHKLFLLPGDRLKEGLVLEENVVFNISLANLDRASSGLGVLNSEQTHEDSLELVSLTELHPVELDEAASHFSGGNQQKIVMCKGLYAEAEIYLFVEPTIGVDIGARATIYRLLRKLSQTAAVVVMSSDCDEVHGVSDRMFALYKGEQVSAPVSDISRDELLIAGISGESKA